MAADLSKEKSGAVSADDTASSDVQDGDIRYNSDALKRHLGNRQIQMIAIGGSVGTALFISIGGGLMNGGPGSLFIAYSLYSVLLGLVNSCMAEMAVFMPISGMYANYKKRQESLQRRIEPVLTPPSSFFHSICR